MSDRKEAAAKWAAAKEALEVASAALKEATESQMVAALAEAQAWDELEQLAGRAVPVAVAVDESERQPMTQEEYQRSLGPLQQWAAPPKVRLG